MSDCTMCRPPHPVCTNTLPRTARATRTGFSRTAKGMTYTSRSEGRLPQFRTMCVNPCLGSKKNEKYAMAAPGSRLMSRDFGM
eukprot:2957787-Rhodomonas_salina.2